MRTPCKVTVGTLVAELRRRSPEVAAKFDSAAGLRLAGNADLQYRQVLPLLSECFAELACDLRNRDTAAIRRIADCTARMWKSNRGEGTFGDVVMWLGGEGCRVKGARNLAQFLEVVPAGGVQKVRPGYMMRMVRESKVGECLGAAVFVTMQYIDGQYTLAEYKFLYTAYLTVAKELAKGFTPAKRERELISYYSTKQGETVLVVTHRPSLGKSRKFGADTEKLYGLATPEEKAEAEADDLPPRE